MAEAGDDRNEKRSNHYFRRLFGIGGNADGDRRRCQSDRRSAGKENLPRRHERHCCGNIFSALSVLLMPRQHLPGCAPSAVISPRTPWLPPARVFPYGAWYAYGVVRAGAGRTTMTNTFGSATRTARDPDLAFVRSGSLLCSLGDDPCQICQTTAAGRSLRARESSKIRRSA